MVAGYVAALTTMAREGKDVRRFVADVCREGGLDPSQYLVILAEFRSNVGERFAMQIAGTSWLDQHGGARFTDEAGCRDLEARRREGGAEHPSWPYRILGGGDLAVWLAPFAGLPPHLAWLWDDASWLADGELQSADAHLRKETPARPDGTMPWVVRHAGHWRAWMPAPAPRWSLRALLGLG
jgi:hypothetical protein